MDYEQILAERRDEILLLTLNRPERLNAWTPRMSQELSHAILAANDDSAIGAVVVTGAGRGFCAGADIGGQFAANLDAREATPPPPSDRPRSDQPAPPAAGWVTLCRRSKPLVAAINGPIIGVGLTMVLPFDRLVAAESAKLSARFVKMGLVPELASSHYLVTRCGWGAASWLALTGVTILAAEAERIRLVDRVVPDGYLMEAALADAHELAASPWPQVSMIKDLLSANACETDLDLIQRREIDALERAYRTPEHREADQAFLEKRPPRFTGR